jgi:hypothetical protein
LRCIHRRHEPEPFEWLHFGSLICASACSSQRLLELARALVERAEADVAVGDEGAHTARLGEGQRVLIAALSQAHFRRIAARRDFAKQPQRPRLVATLVRVAR